MAENGKRKDGPAGGWDQQQSKKKKTGNAGKWKTPHQQAKVLHQEANLQPGDTGIWVTCARHQEGKAAREIGVLFAEYAEKMYDIKSIHDAGPASSGDGDGDDAEHDIEAAIQKELAALTAKTGATDATSSSTGGDADNRMKAIKMNVDCLLYVKTRPPVDPVAFVRRICEDARKCEELPGVMRCRYVNRLTPVSVMGRATETGLAEVAREVLGEWFDLGGKRSSGTGDRGTEPQAGSTEEDATGNATAESKSNDALIADSGKKPFTFAIRPTIRNHSNLKRDVVINTVAGLINDDRHKVNLSSPDKVILVDIHQTVCGMSVVDGDWDELKRYNLTELYSQARNVSTTKD